MWPEKVESHQIASEDLQSLSPVIPERFQQCECSGRHLACRRAGLPSPAEIALWKPSASNHIERLDSSALLTVRQDAALHGKRDVCRYHHPSCPSALM
jgi:hypothetical protein